MNLHTVASIAKQDAAEYARSQVFYGEGAGIRRNLISARIAGNEMKFPGYTEAFEKALAKQDWSEHATKAVRERKRIDAGKFVKRNVRGITTGNLQNVTASIGVAVAVYSLVHQAGLDEPLVRAAKKQHKRVQAEVKVWKAKRKLAKEPKIS